MGTKHEKTGLSESEQTENNTDDTEFGSIAKALSEGNQEELDRLMAAKDEDDDTPSSKTPDESPDEDEDDTKDDGVDTPESDEEEDESPEESDDDEPLFKDEKEPDKGDKKEAATPAASPAIDKDLEQELHRLRSDAGRVPFMQRRLAELERELRAYRARTPEPSKDSKKTDSKPDYSKIELDEETAKDIADLAEVDPVLARTLERVAKSAIHKAQTSSDHVVETFTRSEQEAADERFYMEQKAELTRMIPRHDEVFSMPEWKQWKDSLTPGQKALAESGYASEVAQAIYAFANHMRQREGVTDDGDKTPPPAKPKTEVSEARSRKVDSTADVKSSAAKHDEPFDENKYFREMYNKIGKDSHIL